MDADVRTFRLSRDVRMGHVRQWLEGRREGLKRAGTMS